MGQGTFLFCPLGQRWDKDWDKMSRVKSMGYKKWDKDGTTVRQTGRTGHSLESCPTVPKSVSVERHDLIAREMECKWGVDRLHLLVASELGEKFIAQRNRFNEALSDDDEARIIKHSAGMVKAYEVLDAEAVKIGAKPIDGAFWELAHPTLEALTVRLVQTAAEMPLTASKGVAYLTAQELIQFVPVSVLAAKQAFPGAKVESVKPVDEDLNDELPF